MSENMPVVKKEKNNGFKKLLATVLVSAIVGAGAGVGAAELVIKKESALDKGLSIVQESKETGTKERLSAESSNVVSIAKAVMPAVVGVNTYAKGSDFTKGGDIFSGFLPNFKEDSDRYSQISYGSGVIISNDGIIITNNHVIQGGSKVSVTLQDGRQHEAEVLGSDAQSDLAVLKIKAEGLTAVPIGKSKDLQVGESVVAVGNPLSQEFSQTVTDGIISGINRKLKDDTESFNLIQTNAAINSGNSGGALVDSNGHLIGINTAKIAATGVEGIGFAIPIDEAMKIVDELVKKGKIEHAYIGFSGYVLNEEVAAQLDIKEKSGVIVASVVGDGPADKAGLRPYDIIVEADNTSVKNFEDITKLLAGKKPNDKMTLGVVRDGKKQNMTVTLGVKPTVTA